MLGRTREALAVCRGLVRRGVSAIPFGDCGEDIAWARGLIADCHYRMAHCHAEEEKWRMAMKSLTAHLSQLGPGCRSIYPIANIRRELQSAQHRSARPQNR
jgi:hypothetical protein